MKWLALVSLIFTVSQILAYPQKEDFVNDESDMSDKDDAHLMEAELFAYAELLKGMRKPSVQSQYSESPYSQLPNTPPDVAVQTKYTESKYLDSPNTPSSSMRDPFHPQPTYGTGKASPSFQSSLENFEHVTEGHGINSVQQRPDEIADHQTNALCPDPEECNCKLHSQVEPTQLRRNGVVTANCYIVGIPYCEGPCHGVFRYVEWEGSVLPLPCNVANSYIN